ncbi:MAG: hypothetical protein K9G76_04400 [Bacteroidales bacterium]|nr:hypothetical protein [Bacteroidales bacterium]MCF8403665.1 hypothetical protein [Bacteroidales bacterium]
MSSRITTILIYSIFLSIFSQAQSIGIGEWRDHLPYRATHSITAGDNKVYCASPYGLMYYDNADFTLKKLTRVNGLNDIGISRIGYNDPQNALLVAYNNTNIDLIKGNTIINMADIYNSTAITPEEKSINNLMYISNLAYLSCGFGIVVIDVAKEEVVDTWYIGPDGSHLKVFDLTYDDSWFYAATEEGIYYASQDSPNLAYFGSWSKDETLPDANGVYNHIAYNNGVLFANKFSDVWAQDTIFFKLNGQWQYDVEKFFTDDVHSLKTFDGQLYVVQSLNVRIYNPDLSLAKTIWSYFEASCQPRDIVVDNSGLWLADNGNGMILEESYNKFRFFYPNGPLSTDVFDMSLENENLWIVPGGRNLSWGNIWKRGSISSMRDEDWNTINKSTPGAETLDTLYDLLCVAVNPFNTNQVFAGSWSRGLIEFNSETMYKFYNPENSSLEYKQNEGAPVCKVGGLAFDASGNLWVANSGANSILSVRVNDGSELGTWASFYLGSFSSGKDIGQLIIDSYGQKWILWRDHSIIVFNDNNTPLNPNDDQVAKHLTGAQNNGNLPGTKIFSIAQDNDGEIWIGSDEGIGVIYSPENVFSGFNFDAQQILIPRNDGSGLADILLEFETITAIAVDGDNNKWLGTDKSGVFLVSPDGLEEIHHFTIENSPLLSNTITSIEINHKTGEVFFGTANGIISYKSTATQGGETNEDVYAYPNPVRPGYTGPIAIKGLVNNADFKITNVNGSLVYSGRAEGGQAIWDGNNFNGRHAQSGVYLVFVTDDLGKETLVTKILFMN